jgi:hypothetical protein
VSAACWHPLVKPQMIRHKPVVPAVLRPIHCKSQAGHRRLQEGWKLPDCSALLIARGSASVE